MLKLNGEGHSLGSSVSFSLSLGRPIRPFMSLQYTVSVWQRVKDVFCTFVKYTEQGFTIARKIVIQSNLEISKLMGPFYKFKLISEFAISRFDCTAFDIYKSRPFGGFAILYCYMNTK